MTNYAEKLKLGAKKMSIKNLITIANWSIKKMGPIYFSRKDPFPITATFKDIAKKELETRGVQLIINW